jgi:hypothetical protein
MASRDVPPTRIALGYHLCGQNGGFGEPDFELLQDKVEWPYVVSQNSNVRGDTCHPLFL